jgi:hypothetical protein
MSERGEVRFLSSINPVLWLKGRRLRRHWGGMVVAGMLWLASVPFQWVSERPSGVVERECWAVKRSVPHVAAGERVWNKIEKVKAVSSAVPATLRKAKPVGYLDPAIFWTDAAERELENAVARRPLVAGQILVRGDTVNQGGARTADGLRPRTVRLPAKRALLAEEVRQAGKVWFDRYPAGTDANASVERFGPFKVTGVEKTGSLFDDSIVSITLEMSEDVVGSEQRFVDFIKQLSAPSPDLHVVLLENDHSIVNNGSGLLP